MSGYAPRSFGNEFMGGMQAGQAMGASLAEMDMNSRVGKMASQVQQAGGDVSVLDPGNITSPRDIQALGKFQEQYMQTKEGQAKVFEAYSNWGTHQANRVQATMKFLESDAVKSNPELWAAGVQEAARFLGIPENLEYDASAGKFWIMRPDANGKYARTTESLSAEDIDGYMQKFRQQPNEAKKFVVTAGISAFEQNIRNNQDPTTWLKASDRNGNHIDLVPNTRPGEHGGLEPGFLVMKAGSPSQYVPSDKLPEYGISMRSSEDALKEKGLRHALAGQGSGDRFGPKGNQAFHIAALQMGYMWDKDQQMYFKTTQDFDGKPIPDYNSAMSPDMMNELMRRTGGGSGASPAGLANNDPLGLFNKGKENTNLPGQSLQLSGKAPQLPEPVVNAINNVGSPTPAIDENSPDFDDYLVENMQTKTSKTPTGLHTEYYYWDANGNRKALTEEKGLEIIKKIRAIQEQRRKENDLQGQQNINDFSQAFARRLGL